MVCNVLLLLCFTGIVHTSFCASSLEKKLVKGQDAAKIKLLEQQCRTSILSNVLTLLFASPELPDILINQKRLLELSVQEENGFYNVVLSRDCLDSLVTLTQCIRKSGIFLLQRSNAEGQLFALRMKEPPGVPQSVFIPHVLYPYGVRIDYHYDHEGVDSVSFYTHFEKEEILAAKHAFINSYNDRLDDIYGRPRAGRRCPSRQLVSPAMKNLDRLDIFLNRRWR